MRVDKKDLLLYAVTDRSWLGSHTLYQDVEAAIKGVGDPLPYHFLKHKERPTL